MGPGTVQAPRKSIEGWKFYAAASSFMCLAKSSLSLLSGFGYYSFYTYVSIQKLTYEQSTLGKQTDTPILFECTIAFFSTPPATFAYNRSKPYGPFSGKAGGCF
jgi:hypothetical protein